MFRPNSLFCFLGQECGTVSDEGFEVVPQEPESDTPMWEVDDEDEDRQNAKKTRSMYIKLTAQHFGFLMRLALFRHFRDRSYHS
jgi:hypothetical protein